MGNKGPQLNHSRLAKIEFPKFSGDDVKGWVFRCDQFFVRKQTPEMDNVPLISIHLYDKALLWHSQFIRIHGNNVSLGVYKQAIMTRFGNVYDDLMSELKILKYETTAREYEDAFDNLLGRVEFSEDHVKYVPGHKCSGPLYSLVLLPEIENEGGEFLEEDESLVDIVADGNKLVTNAKCKEFKWPFAPNVFTTDVMLLPLGGCEMTSDKSVRQTELYSVAMCVFPNSAATCMQIEEVPATSIHPILQQVIAAYEDVFAIPTELLPRRDHDHTIPLIEGAQPVNIRPYRHPPS
ncbi:hypothetical protein Tco_0365278 [Tanacetum coccineum]